MNPIVQSFSRDVIDLLAGTLNLSLKQPKDSMSPKNPLEQYETIQTHLCQENSLTKLIKDLRLRVFLVKGTKRLPVEYWNLQLKENHGAKSTSTIHLETKRDIAFNSLKCLIASRPLFHFLVNNDFSSSLSKKIRIESDFPEDELWKPTGNFTESTAKLLTFETGTFTISHGTLSIQEIEAFFLENSLEYIDWKGLAQNREEQVIKEDEIDSRELSEAPFDTLYRTSMNHTLHFNGDSNVKKESRVKSEALKEPLICFEEEIVKPFVTKGEHISKNGAFSYLQPSKSSFGFIDNVNTALEDIKSSVNFKSNSVCSQKLLSEFDEFYYTLSST